MRIEQRLAEQIRSFHLDALSSAVALNVDLDTTLTVWAAAAYDHLRQRLPGYQAMTPDTIWRRFISTSGQITVARMPSSNPAAASTNEPVQIETIRVCSGNAREGVGDAPWENSVLEQPHLRLLRRDDNGICATQQRLVVVNLIVKSADVRTVRPSMVQVSTCTAVRRRRPRRRRRRGGGSRGRTEQPPRGRAQRHVGALAGLLRTMASGHLS